MPILTRYDPIQCNSNSLSWSDSTFFPHKKTEHSTSIPTQHSPPVLRHTNSSNPLPQFDSTFFHSRRPSTTLFPDTTRSSFSILLHTSLPTPTPRHNSAPPNSTGHTSPRSRPAQSATSSAPTLRDCHSSTIAPNSPPPPQNIFTEHPSRTQTLLSSLPDTTGSGVFRWKAPPYQMCLGDITSLAKHCKRSAVRQAACQACASRNLSVRESYPTGSRWSGRPNC